MRETGIRCYTNRSITVLFELAKISVQRRFFRSLCRILKENNIIEGCDRGKRILIFIRTRAVREKFAAKNYSNFWRLASILRQERSKYQNAFFFLFFNLDFWISAISFQVRLSIPRTYGTVQYLEICSQLKSYNQLRVSMFYHIL